MVSVPLHAPAQSITPLGPEEDSTAQEWPPPPVSASQRSHTWKEQKAPTVVASKTEYARVSLLIHFMHLLIVVTFDVPELRKSFVT